MTPTASDRGRAGRPRRVSDDQIFDALAQAISEQGPHQWTLPGVGKRIGLTGPALAYRFGNKRGLLLAFAAHQPDATDAHFAETTVRARSPREAIIDALVGLISAMTTKQQVANNVAMLSLDLADSELAQHTEHQARIIKTRVADLIHATDQRPASTAATDAAHLYTVWSGAIITWAIDGKGTLADWTTTRLATAMEHLAIPAPDQSPQLSE